MTRSPKGRRRGTIEAKGEGRFLVRLAAGKDPVTGKYARLSRLVRGTRKDAEAALTELLSQQDKGLRLPLGRATFGRWLDEYAETWAAHLSPRTRERADELLRLYLPAALRDVRLTALTAEMFQGLYNRLEAAGKSPVTISLLHRTLRARLNKAVELRHLAVNPIRYARPPAVKRREARVLSTVEARRFLALADGTRFAPLWVLLLSTGLRPEEALGLQWADLQGSTLHVRRALVRLRKGRWELREPKTGNGRTVVLPAAAVRALKAHRARQAEARLLLGEQYDNRDLIFTGEHGKPLDWPHVAHRYFRPLRDRLALDLLGKPTTPPTMLGRSLAKYREEREAFRKEVTKAHAKTGLKRFRPYDLRHSAATLLLAAGEPVKVVSEMLGHANVAITLAVYTHVLPGQQEQAARRMEAILGA